jgi:hypothetical protein
MTIPNVFPPTYSSCFVGSTGGGGGCTGGGGGGGSTGMASGLDGSGGLAGGTGVCVDSIIKKVLRVLQSVSCQVSE